MSGSTGLATRIVPPVLLRRRRAVHLLERNFLTARRSWGIIVSGFVEPVFYLFAVGVGIGALVGDVTGPDGQPVTYAQYVAPALLAASAMNGAVFESTINIFFKLRFQKTYDGVLATPMEPGDIAVGEVSYSLMRGALYAVGFLTVTAIMGLLLSPWAILALPAALLIGFAFAAVGMASSTFLKSWQDLDLVTLVMLPLFLFSATFYPISVYPEPVQWLVRLSPLYHGVEITRAVMLGSFDVSLVGHVAFLAAMGAAGTLVAAKRFGRILRS